MRRLGAVAVAATLVLAACGGNGDGQAGGLEGGPVGAIDAARCAEVAAALASATIAAGAAFTGSTAELDQQIEVLDGFAGSVPSEIAGDFSTVAEGYASVSRAVADSGFDPASGQAPSAEAIAAIEAAGAQLEQPDFQQALQGVNDWFASECGVAP